MRVYIIEYVTYTYVPIVAKPNNYMIKYWESPFYDPTNTCV